MSCKQVILIQVNNWAKTPDSNLWLSVHVTTGEDTMCCSKQNLRKRWYTEQPWSSRWLDVEQRDFLQPHRWLPISNHTKHTLREECRPNHLWTDGCAHIWLLCFQYTYICVIFSGSKRKSEIGLNNTGHLFCTSEHLFKNCFDIMKNISRGETFH